MPQSADRDSDRRRPPEEPETLEQRLARIPLADLIGEQPVNGKIACPFHEDDTPSLHIYRDHYHCFGCGAHGGHLDWLREVEGLSADAAIDVIFHWQGRTSSPRRDRRRAHAQAGAGAVARRRSRSPARRRSAISPTCAASMSRCCRPTCRCAFIRAARSESGKRLPCLIALYPDVESDEPAGIHRIALDAGSLGRRRSGAALARAAGRGRARSSCGRRRRSLYLGEGIETVLAAATRLPYRDGALMRPAWAAVSTGGIGKFPVLPDVQELRLLLDHDAEGEACAVPCRERWEAAGRKVTRLRPPQPGYDFNDVVLEKLRAAS